MNEYLAFTSGVDATRRLALSALPDAPVVADVDHAAGRARSWAAARLHSIASAADQLANRVDPVCATH